MSDLEEGEIPESLVEQCTSPFELPNIFPQQAASMSITEGMSLFQDLENSYANSEGANSYDFLCFILL